MTTYVGYIAERRGALEKWDAYVQGLVFAGKSSVAFLATKDSAGAGR